MPSGQKTAIKYHKFSVGKDILKQTHTHTQNSRKPS